MIIARTGERNDVCLIFPPLLSVVAQIVQLKHDFAADVNEYFYLLVYIK